MNSGCREDDSCSESLSRQINGVRSYEVPVFMKSNGHREFYIGSRTSTSDVLTKYEDPPVLLKSDAPRARQFYAVRYGRRPGIYIDKKHVYEATRKVRYVQHRVFSTYAEAKFYIITGMEVTPKEMERLTEEESSLLQPEYIDLLPNDCNQEKPRIHPSAKSPRLRKNMQGAQVRYNSRRSSLSSIIVSGPDRCLCQEICESSLQYYPSFYFRIYVRAKPEKFRCSYFRMAEPIVYDVESNQSRENESSRRDSHDTIFGQSEASSEAFAFMGNDDHGYTNLNEEFSLSNKVAPKYLGKPEKYTEYKKMLKRWELQADNNDEPVKLALRAISRLSGEAAEAVKLMDEDKLYASGRKREDSWTSTGGTYYHHISEDEDGLAYFKRQMDESKMMMVVKNSGEDMETYTNRFKVQLKEVNDLMETMQERLRKKSSSRTTSTSQVVSVPDWFWCLQLIAGAKLSKAEDLQLRGRFTTEIRENPANLDLISITKELKFLFANEQLGHAQQQDSSKSKSFVALPDEAEVWYDVDTQEHYTTYFGNNTEVTVKEDEENPGCYLSLHQ